MIEGKGIGHRVLAAFASLLLQYFAKDYKLEVFSYAFLLNLLDLNILFKCALV